MIERGSIARVEPDGNGGWCVVSRDGMATYIKDGRIATAVLNLILHAHAIGRQEAFEDLRELIGAES